MAARLPDPFLSWSNSAGAPYAGGTLYFYATNSSTPLAVYSDETLSSSIGTSVPLNSAGRPDTAIFLQNLPYKVVLKDSSGNEIWTADPVSGTDFLSTLIAKVGSGSPSGVVAGTAGSSGVLPTAYWDYVGFILYVCTTTGSAATAVWTAINAAASTPVVTTPQGYLTPSSGTPVILSDASAATAIYYTPFVGNLVPIYNGSRFVPTEFSELTLTLHSSHSTSALFDVFVFSNSGTLTLATGPAWTTATAGSCARGTGAGTTELTRLLGFWVNNVQITGRNGATTYTIGANLATYLGSIFIDSGAAGQVTCHRAWGSSRKWGVWNAFNRQPLHLKAGDSTATWTYTTNTIRPSRNQTTNSLTVFSGLAEEFYDLRFGQCLDVAHNNNVTCSANNGIGWNSTTAITGRTGRHGEANNTAGMTYTHYTSINAEYQQVPAIGINVVTALETAPDTGGTVTWRGGEDDMVLSARWRG